MSQLEIRRVVPGDLGALAKVWTNADGFFQDRLARQERRIGELLCGWSKGTPVGHVYLWLDDAEEEELREHLPGVPLLMNLRVASAWRNRGVATSLLQEAERRLADVGHDRVALAVEQTNTPALSLYRGRDYRDWNLGTVICLARDWSKPDKLVYPEICRILVKDLSVR